MDEFEAAVDAIGRRQLGLEVTDRRREVLGAEMQAIRRVMEGCGKALHPSDDLFDHQALFHSFMRRGQ